MHLAGDPRPYLWSFVFPFIFVVLMLGGTSGLHQTRTASPVCRRGARLFRHPTQPALPEGIAASLAVAALLVTTLLLPVQATAYSGLVLSRGSVGEVSLVDQHGENVSLDGLNEEILVVAFVFRGTARTPVQSSRTT
ncbi:MAG: hypothetical protein CM15mP128_1980 [Methanobacteriota archaeon]|nr:MAG: hypothetical protein CM15mP128_1980 [Euryarchaeota archaeon]